MRDISDWEEILKGCEEDLDRAKNSLLLARVSLELDEAYVAALEQETATLRATIQRRIAVQP